MKKIFILLVFSLCTCLLQAQHKATILFDAGNTVSKDSIYITGTFNNWNYKADENYRLAKKGNNQWEITLDLKAGKNEFRFHRGSRAKREMKMYDSITVGEAPLRAMNIQGDTGLWLSCNTWLDRIPYTPVFFMSKSLVPDFLSFGELNIWQYKAEQGSNGANSNTNTSDWKNIKPSDIKEFYADNNDRIEGWFRTNIYLDSSFTHKPFELIFSSWAALDVYIDGELMYNMGHTGRNGLAFAEARPVHAYPKAFFLEPGRQHVVAIHFADHLSRLPFKSFKGPIEIYYNSDERLADFKQHITLEPVFTAITFTVSILLMLLFWMLTFLLPKEHNLKRIAVYSTLLFLITVSTWMSHNPFASYNSIQITDFLANFIIPAILIYSIYLLVKIFRRKVTSPLKVLFGLIGSVSVIMAIKVVQLVGLVTIITVISVIIYYILTSLKTLKGAQWAVVGGIAALFLCLSANIVYSMLNKQSSYIVNSIMNSAVELSFPLSLVVYVSLRFKEIIHAVRENASKVVELSEQQKEQAINQQKILEQEVASRTAELRTSLENLKATQSQLIQSEKMASLGELTAGIAHEIQNPLNFVNNFSEVSNELIEELNEELNKGDVNEAKSISNDIKTNLEKINHHGKRADAIVKGMLQHSRTSSRQKEPTDINALCDEYLRLAYHGLRAKDKSFNTDFKTQFDDSIGKINIVSQDIGRVLLNLINNAFYAVNEKAKTSPPPEGGVRYSPMVTISTKTIKPPLGGLGVEISVKDNGGGIPESIKEKIFQPFFTTKPTGSGTGLGLSLSYDIIKAHGGEIKVNAKENEGTEFIIQLPV